MHTIQSWDLPPCRHLAGAEAVGEDKGGFVGCTCHVFYLFLEDTVKQDACDLIP